MTVTFCARRVTNVSIPCNVIEVCVGVDDDPDVVKVEPELLDAASDQWHHLLHARVEQYVSGGRHEEERRDLLGSDVVDVPDEVERLKWHGELIE
jgi:hypothetical protein